MGALAGDFKFALRMLRRSPGVTAAAVLALALGIGANTAIFSVVDGVLLRPLPYPDSRRARRRALSARRASPLFNGPFSFPDFKDLLAQIRAFENVGAWTGGDANLSGGGTPERVLIRASPRRRCCRRCGVQPIVGRNFVPDEALKGNDHVAMLDYGLAQRRFGGAAGAVGQNVRLDGVDYQIVGVLPRGFRSTAPADVWMPLSTSFDMMEIRNAHFLRVRRPRTRRRRRRPASPPISTPSPSGSADTLARHLSAVARARHARARPTSTRSWATCGCRSSCCSARSPSCCSSPAPTWPTCCSRAPPRASARWPSAPRSAPAAGGWCASS